MQLQPEQSAARHNALAQNSLRLDEEVLEVCAPVTGSVNKRGRPLQLHACELPVQTSASFVRP